MLAREEIDRLIAALSKGQIPASHANALRLKAARELRRARRRRLALFPGIGFADPAWDMLLDLYCAKLSDERATVSSLCLASGVPATTALRWMQLLVSSEYITRVPDRTDRRRFYVALAPGTVERMNQWIDATFADGVL